MPDGVEAWAMLSQHAVCLNGMALLECCKCGGLLHGQVPQGQGCLGPRVRCGHEKVVMWTRATLPLVVGRV